MEFGQWEPPSSKHMRIVRLQNLILESEDVCPGRCAECDCRQFVRYGRTMKGTPRFRCKGCGRTFTSCGLIGGSQLSKETWMIFAECTVEGLSIRKTAERCNVSVTTAYRMKDRLERFLERETGPRDEAPAPMGCCMSARAY